MDNPQLAAILPRAQRRVFTYGVAPQADYHLEFLSTVVGSFARFQIRTALAILGPFELHVPGRHNVLNATAAVAIAHQLGVSAEEIALGLSHFNGVDRRFQFRGKIAGITVVDDYGHHPTEIRATLAAARECGHRRIHVVFQPHRFSRTKDLLDQFTTAFNDADTLVVLPIYAASEEPIPGVTAESLVQQIAEQIAAAKPSALTVSYAPDFPVAVSAVVAQAQPGDLILTLGAGNVSQLAPQILAALQA